MAKHMLKHTDHAHQLDFPAEEKFRQVYESKMMGILLWDTQGKIIDANEALLEMIGYSREEMLKGELRWRNITPPEYAQLDEQAYALLLAGSEVVPYEKQYFHKDGHRIDILIRSAMLQDSRDVGLACIIDITARKQAEQQLNQQKKELAEYAALLEHSNRDLEQFATVIAFDFQSPLRKLQRFSEHLMANASSQLDPEAAVDLERIARITKRMQDQCKQLLALSKVGRTSSAREEVDLNDLMRQTLLDLHYFLKEKKARVQAVKMGTINANPALMRHLFLKAIESILYLTPEDKPISLSIFAQHATGNFYEIVLEHTVPSLTENLFDNPLGALQSSKGVEVGFGFATVKKIVERHHGYIRTESSAEGTSKLIIGLPLSE